MAFTTLRCGGGGGSIRCLMARRPSRETQSCSTRSPGNITHWSTSYLLCLIGQFTLRNFFHLTFNSWHCCTWYKEGQQIVYFCPSFNSLPPLSFYQSFSYLSSFLPRILDFLVSDLPLPRHHSGHYVCEADNGFSSTPVSWTLPLWSTKPHMIRQCLMFPCPPGAG